MDNMQQPEGSNVGQGRYVLVESSWTSVILRYIFSVSPLLTQRLESKDGYTTLTSRLCSAMSFIIVRLITQYHVSYSDNHR